MNAEDCIRLLELDAHPEGGHYRQTYRSGESLAATALPARYDGARPASTAIHFLLRAGEVSHLHRLASDELWHFHLGAPLVVHVISPDGGYRAHRLGPDLAGGEQLQLAVPHGSWFGAEVAADHGFALVGNTVAPGFDFADFELAEAAHLVRAHPAHADLIQRLSAR